jgi:hypothetical protein
MVIRLKERVLRVNEEEKGFKKEEDMLLPPSETTYIRLI